MKHLKNIGFSLVLSIITVFITWNIFNGILDYTYNLIIFQSEFLAWVTFLLFPVLALVLPAYFLYQGKGFKSVVIVSAISLALFVAFGFATVYYFKITEGKYKNSQEVIEEDFDNPLIPRYPDN